MRRGRTGRVVMVALAALALAAQAPSEPEGGLSESIDVTLETVEVVVENADGAPVLGLGRDAFKLTIDGDERTITYFEAPRAPTAASAAAPPEADASASPPVATRTFALFVDEASLEPASRRRALEALGTELARGRTPGDRVLIVAPRGEQVDVVLAPTADPGAIAAGLARAADRPAARDAGEMARALGTLAEIGDPNAEEAGGAPTAAESRGSSRARTERTVALNALRELVERRSARTLATIGALGRVVDALGGMDGTRAIVVVSGGITAQPGGALIEAALGRFTFSDAAQASQRLELEANDRAVGAALTLLGERANRARVSLYGLPLDAGLPSLSLAGKPVTAGMAPTATVRETLSRLALETGGVTPAGSDLGAALRAAQADVGASYTVGWAPGRADREGAARVEVRISDPTLVVRHRRAAPPLDRLGTLRDRTLAALLLDATENPLDLKLEVESVEPVGGSAILSVAASLPLARLALVPRERVHEGSLTFLFGALDAEGRLSDLQGADVPVRVANEQLLDALSRVATYRVKLTLRPTAQRLVVGAIDRVSGARATVAIPWTPESPPLRTATPR